MFAENRWREILDIVKNDKEVIVAELAKHFNVTQETIRRDLKKLSSEGRLRRTHGGAVAFQNDNKDAPFSVRESEYIGEKRAIAAAALQYIKEGDRILLDSSSTVSELAKMLPNIPITIITNSANALISLSLLDKAKVILTGGLLDPISLSLEGGAAIEALERYNPNKLFFSCKGVDMERGLSEATEEHAYIKKKMMELSRRKYLLADHSKFGIRSTVFLAELEAVECLITDSGINAAIIEDLKNRGLKVETASCQKNEMRHG